MDRNSTTRANLAKRLQQKQQDAIPKKIEKLSELGQIQHLTLEQGTQISKIILELTKYSEYIKDPVAIINNLRIYDTQLISSNSHITQTQLQQYNELYIFYQLLQHSAAQRTF